MQSFKLCSVLFATLMVIYGAPEESKYKEIFMKCSAANGYNPKIMKELNESMKEGEKSAETTEDSQKKYLCTQKCIWEELDFLSGTKIDIEQLRKSELVKVFGKKENIDAYLDCIKPIEVKDCEDFGKIYECLKVMSSQS